MTRHSQRKNVGGSNGVPGSEPRHPVQASSPTASTELLLIVRAAQLILSKAAALCVTTSKPESTTAESQPLPKYIDEASVAEVTGISQAWLQRARSEGIGPPHKKIATRVVYRLDRVLDWVESGAAALEHVSSPRPTKKKAPPLEP